MSRSLGLLLLGLPLALAGCQTSGRTTADGRRPSVVIEEPEEWRGVASDPDAAALESLPALWATALGEARSRYGRAVAAEGALLVAGAALPRAAPAPGPYRCRAIRLGARTAAARPWSVSRSGFCFVGVAGDQLSLTSELAGTRMGGYLFDLKQRDSLVFLGGAIAPRARSAPAYGENRAQDRAGRFERIGDFRYRLALPSRDGDSRLIVLELVAAPPT